MSHDTQLHRLVRPAVRLAARTGLRPNHVTGLRIATAVVAAVAFGVATTGSIRFGALVFAVSALLDRADGELARLTGRFSPLGHRLDLVGDFAADVMAFVAMGVGARHGWLHGAAPVLGASAALGVGLLFRHNNRPGRPPAPEQRAVDPDDMILVVPMLACVAGLAPVLLLAGIVAPLAACVLMLRDRRAWEPVGAGDGRQEGQA